MTCGLLPAARFVVATANEISKLPPNLFRSEWFDALFMLDLPGPAERRAIWRMCLERFDRNDEQRLPRDDNWTGAEIRACCRVAALLDVPLAQAAQNVVQAVIPISANRIGSGQAARFAAVRSKAHL
jgi:SpoVK/Ycf46/Vps4 family AAA+-type ATPase